LTQNFNHYAMMMPSTPIDSVSSSKKAMNRLATKQQKRQLLIIQDFCCALCGKELDQSFQVDHIIPFSLGGTTSLGNLQGVCVSCHKEKTRKDGSCRPISISEKGNKSYTK